MARGCTPLLLRHTHCCSFARPDRTLLLRGKGQHYCTSHLFNVVRLILLQFCAPEVHTGRRGHQDARLTSSCPLCHRTHHAIERRYQINPRDNLVHAGAAAQLKKKQQSQHSYKGFQHVLLRASATTTAPVLEKQELEMVAPQPIYRKVRPAPASCL